MRDLGIVHKPLLATVAPNRNKPDQVVAFIENQLCFFERDTPVPAVGETVEVMITRPVHPKGDRFFDFDRLTGLMIQVVDRTRHALVAIGGFECSGSMCSTTAWGAVTDGSRALGRDDIIQGSGPGRRELRDNFTITPGRSRIRFADNVNAKHGEYLPSIPTNIWVELNNRTGRAERQPRGGCVRVAGLTRIEDLECAHLVRRLSKAA
jgi:hypothetical protein